MKIFVTGGSGMVGRNFVENTLAQGHDLLVPSSRELDLLDAAAVDQWMQQHAPDFVVHCAGKVGGIQANMREPVSFLLDNLDMGRNVVMAARRAGVRRLINLGSSCMYPRNAQNPLVEDMILKGELEPTNEGYAIAKVAVARLCEYITREDPSFQFKTLIPCNLYGRYDKFDPRHSHLVPAIIHKLHQARLQSEQAVDIWGDGQARREFMYAGDLADCMWQAVERFDTLPAMMNVGVGDDLSVNEYYQTAARVVGYEGGFVHDLTKPVGMARKLVSVGKASTWGWQSRTSLEEGLAKTYQHYLEHLQP